MKLDGYTDYQSKAEATSLVTMAKEGTLDWDILTLILGKSLTVVRQVYKKENWTRANVIRDRSFIDEDKLVWNNDDDDVRDYANNVMEDLKEIKEEIKEGKKYTFDSIKWCTIESLKFRNGEDIADKIRYSIIEKHGYGNEDPVVISGKLCYAWDDVKDYLLSDLDKYEQSPKDLTDSEKKYLYTEFKGEKKMIIENALDILDDRLELLRMPLAVYDKIHHKETEIIALAICLNDVFLPKGADLEILSFGEIETLFNYCFDENGKWKSSGYIEYVANKRNIGP